MFWQIRNQIGRRFAVLLSFEMVRPFCFLCRKLANSAVFLPLRWFVVGKIEMFVGHWQCHQHWRGCRRNVADILVGQKAFSDVNCKWDDGFAKIGGSVQSDWMGHLNLSKIFFIVALPPHFYWLLCICHANEFCCKTNSAAFLHIGACEVGSVQYISSKVVVQPVNSVRFRTVSNMAEILWGQCIGGCQTNSVALCAEKIGKLSKSVTNNALH